MPKARRGALGKMKLAGSWHGNYHLPTVATLTEEQADLLPGVPSSGKDAESIWHPWFDFEPRDLVVMIDYPLDEPVKVLVQAEEYVHPSGLPSFGRFVLAIARKYAEIYRDPKRYGIWGHGLGDLYFERVSIPKDGPVTLFIGS